MSFSLQRMIAVLRKEFFQMMRDHVSVGMIIIIPLIQLILFGFAINTNPKQLPAALVSLDHSVLTRTLVRAIENSNYFRIVNEPASMSEANQLLATGKVLFVITIPSDFTKRFFRNTKPEILIEADASDPVAVTAAVGAMQQLTYSVFDRWLTGNLAELKNAAPNANFIIHAKYNPEEITQYNIVPGLLGVVLTMTLVLVTSMAITRERERGTMEYLLATPVRPLEVMLGKILPYVIMGYIQVMIILICAYFLFHIPMRGSVWLLLLSVLPFIAANLSVGLTFSSIARNQLQAMQMAFFFFLPSLLLSGFMFPFYGMPAWAQYLGGMLPLTYFLRIVRGIVLKGNSIALIWPSIWPMVLFMLVVLLIAWKRYRRTLD
ncbi:MAG: mannose-1-phosphate guanyltransferase [Gammaproteobacteria bacterium RIFCSPLOWO2_02_FULL_42_14]|nr:MAG: mannose-1-phosphate guanyltransferase [Gammaproteobacteria bacterium RIFCSPHIGHO2_02_FULL_42_43]OGT50775.1 MAG: mannose-1-phosphate guanyltransferase [Gammaproteobacteria bacterium RIFCSPHIGHO2_12_FULL_41_25]OGT61760.1 MAG: mannose-1-phosphate guanyltransferase [Gammaproteobacteria bacterium RIFCSPLOWO2_02_FULL_42_14]OGT85504.1 MAG: mannose-1-phosphate guanyltransferase [Gammaproteobacteria bacterium RIFCSPLOWO2_12_FULL_42_18]